MPPFVKNKEAFKEAVDQFAIIHEWYKEFSRKHNKEPQKVLEELKFDSRDFFKFVYFLDRPKNKEEYLKCVEQEYENIQKDYYGTMDRFLDAFEKYDFTTLDTKTKDESFELLLMDSLCQIHGNIVQGKKDYKEKRYNTIEKKQQYDKISSIVGPFFHNISDTILRETGFSTSANDYTDMQLEPESIVEEEMHQIDTDLYATKDYDEGKSDHYDINVPDFFYYYNEIHNNQLDDISEDVINKYKPGIDTDIGSVINAIYARCINADSHPARNLGSIDYREHKCIFIDGKALIDCVARKENEPGFKYNKRMNDFLAKSIKDGKAIDIAKLYFDNGKARTEIIPLKMHWGGEILKKYQEEKVVREHNWFRRTFFDWGPFKIKRDPNVMDEVYAIQNATNEESKEMRHNTILDYTSHVLLDEINKDRVRNKLPEIEPGERLFSKFEASKGKVKEDGAILLELDSKEFEDQDINKSFIINNDEITNQKYLEDNQIKEID